jgi:chromosome segregation ATPase
MRASSTAARPGAATARRARLAIVLFVSVAAGTAPALAQDREKQMREAQRRLQAQNQKLQQEKSQAESQAAELQKKLAESEAGMKALEKAKADAKAQSEAVARDLAREAGARRSAAADLDKTRASLADEQQRLRQAQARIEELTRRQAELERTVAERDRQGKALLGSLQQERQSLASCETKNEKLYQYGLELGDRYRNKGVWESLAQREPVTGIKEVEIRTVLDEYRDKLDAERLGRASLQGAK